MRRILACNLVALALLGWTELSYSAEAKPSFETDIRPLLSEFCVTCHSKEKLKGELDLERFTTLTEVKRHPKVWQMVAEQLASNEMPPKNKPQPTTEQKTALLSWVNRTLDEIALARAGDPGPVVLRRLSNAEYTYTVRDITGVESLDPTREFPADSASGEGFMNVGNSLVMSPSLITKYLDAAKQIASHAVLLPDGIRFSPKTSRRDWTEEILTEIREFYRIYTDPRGGDKVNLQGIVFETNEGGRLPLEKYLSASLALRETGTTIEQVAREQGLSPKYLKTVFNILSSNEPAFLLDAFRARWSQSKLSDAPALAEEIAKWQKALWKFSSVGHIGKAGGPKAWMEPLSPISTKQEVRLKLPRGQNGQEVIVYLVATDAGDGNTNDFVIWQEPRLARSGRADVLIRDVRELSHRLTEQRQRSFANAAKALAAAAEVSPEGLKTPELAAKHGIETEVLNAWLDYLGLGQIPKIEGHFTEKIKSASGYDFVNGWGSQQTPNLAANSSDQHVRIPGNLKPHSIAVHPSPKLKAGVGWQSPVKGEFRIEAKVQHAHPECGNGVTWALEFRRGSSRQRLASGTAQGSKEVIVPAVEKISIEKGDVVSILIGARDGNHSCDLTAVDLMLSSLAGERQWDLAKDISGDVLAGNPHADRFGNAGVWHLYTEPDKGGSESLIPAGSLLAKWQAASGAEEKTKLAEAVQKLLTGASPPAGETPDAKLYQQLASLSGPLFRNIVPTGKPSSGATNDWGLDPAQFGKHPKGGSVASGSLGVQAPSVIEIKLPADLAAECEFVATGILEPGIDGSVQLQVLTNKPSGLGLVASGLTVTEAGGQWTSDNRKVSYGLPIIVNEGSSAKQRIEAGFELFRQTFPAALCYTKIVPVDEVVTLTLYYREDHHLSRLMLDEAGVRKLDRLWDELHYVSHDALMLVDALEQLWQYATQDADPKVFEPMREPTRKRAADFRQRLIDTEPAHLQGALDFAEKACRRPLTQGEKDELRGLYKKLRLEELSHDEAIRLTFARILVSPGFLYKLEKPASGSEPAPINDWELANRLSYFLWSSAPDEELRKVAASGKLREGSNLTMQAGRMVKDARTRRLAIEFACAWLHIHGFDQLDEKSERHFPTFSELRAPMYEETIQFFTDFFQHDRSILNVLDADYAFLNEPLASHYGIPGVKGANWRKVDGVKRFSRGGILGQATTLAKQSGASRTSPILRGNWVCEVLLGERLPRPPKDVPRLPEDETQTEGLTVRQLVEKHSSDPRCAGCHVRIDPYGYALENFDAIGRKRDHDLGQRPINTKAKVMDGTELDGLEGLRTYLLTKRKEAFLNQFCRKLLGYALGRSIQVSDRPLLAEMRDRLKANNYRIGTAVETIVNSRQFREIRGRDANYEEETSEQRQTSGEL